LHSERAIRVNIEIMRAFVQLRQWLASNAELGRKLEAMERKYDCRFKVVFDTLRHLMRAPKNTQREIGFHVSYTDEKTHGRKRC